MTAADMPIEALLAEAEAARAGGRSVEGLGLAERAWAAAQDERQRLRAGLLLLHFRYRCGLLALLVDAGLDVLPLLRKHGPAADLIDTLRMVSLGASDVARFDVALACAQEARRLAQEGNDRARLSLATNALGCFHERLGDPWQAERLLLEALAIAREASDIHACFVALNNLCAVLIGAFYLLRDGAPPGEAQGALLRALPHAREAMQLREALVEEFYAPFVQGNLGEVLLHLGRMDEAEASLLTALDSARRQGAEAQVWRIGCTIGELQLLNGRVEDAWHSLNEVLEVSTEADARSTHLRLHHAAWRAARAMERPQQALEHLEHYLRLERARALSQLRGQSQMFVTRLEAEQVRLDAQRERRRATAAEVDARRDQLTGLGNRRELAQRWPALLQRTQAEQRPLALAMIDLDHFKQINDRFGHAVGDAVLVALARMLEDNTRSEDLVVRMGGEEFLLVLPEASLARAVDVCERLRQRVASHAWELLSPGLQVSLSAGVTAAPPYDSAPLMQRADAALYSAKHGGRNRVQTA